MIGLLIALGLGYTGKWRWLGYAYLVDLVVIGAAGLLRGSGDTELAVILIAPLGEVSLGYGLGALAHRLWRGAWPRDKAITGLARVTRGTDADGDPVLTWEIETPVLTAQVMRVFAAVLIVLFVLMAAIFGLIGRGDLGQGVAIAGISCGAVTALFTIVVFGLFFNRLRRRYVLTRSGYATAISDPRMLAGIAAAETAGATTQGPVVAGSALVGAANTSEARNWDTVVATTPDPARHRIHVRLSRFGWLGHDTIVCPAEGYESVAAYVAERTGISKAGAPVATEPIA